MGGIRRPVAVRSIAEMQAALAEEPAESAPSPTSEASQHDQEAFVPPPDDWLDRLPDSEKDRVRERWQWEESRPDEWRERQARRRRRCARDCSLLTGLLAAIVELHPLRIGYALIFGAAAGALIHASSRLQLAVLTFGAAAHIAAGSLTNSFQVGSPRDALFLGCEALLVTPCYGVFAIRLHYRLMDGSDC